ncbi:hypothetical protein [Thalassomonas actiniarum]|uniref:Uncharacterized protein n=1 Tax=Thalassomonas actiniarum TaxID=485447 RepID=A0AAF0C1H9_9GAMM|nr:hypothetical protein [Thalassomonas actiniarum]WDD96744.1 hypothetical protein SG35_015300 [Thalassomonas actiniarum]
MRAPSAYGVENSTSTRGMISERSRQQHDHGPTNTGRMQTVHAFTSSPQMQEAVAYNVDDTVARTGMNVSAALRLEIMDGLASPLATSGAQHLETFTNQPHSMANPHISGGTVHFAQPTSALGDFNTVRARTEHNSQSAHQRPTFRTGVTAHQTPQSVSFNRSALTAQQRFARSVLGGGG